MWITGWLARERHEQLASETGGANRPASRTRAALAFGCAIAPLISACALSLPTRTSHQVAEPNLQRQSTEHLRAGLAYKANPVVRVQAVEALAAHATEDDLPWIRTALSDEHPAVRFAGCMAAGVLKDRVAESKLRELSHDADAGVRVAALFALHRLGRTDRSGELSTFLIDDDNPSVRRNAALALGLIGEPGAIKVLARAMRDPDPGVRQHALEAMARLGQPEARQELVFMSNTGVGTEEVFAVSALAETRDSSYVDTFRYKLSTALHVETKLAAARGLGVCGIDDGLQLAGASLRSPPAPVRDENDPEEEQRLRVRQLAAAALEAMRRREALPWLTEAMMDKDPRIQLAAAKAIRGILSERRTDRASVARRGR